MTGEKKESKSGNEYLFEIISFLITSTKRCLNNESEYCPTRLVQALYQLSFLPDYIQELKDDDFLFKMRQKIEKLYSEGDFWQKPTFKEFANALSNELIDEIKKRKYIK
jgi:hypothetical protein